MPSPPSERGVWQIVASGHTVSTPSARALATATALAQDPHLEGYTGFVQDSGEEYPIAREIFARIYVEVADGREGDAEVVEEIEVAEEA